MYKRRQAPKRNLKRQTTTSMSLGCVCSQPWEIHNLLALEA